VVQDTTAHQTPPLKELLMPLVKVSASLAANATNDNVLAGSQFEFLPYNALLEFAVVGAAAGLLTDVYSGSDALCESAAVSSANRFGLYPDDFDLNDVAAAGERIKVRIRNTTGAAIVYFVTMRITPA
jgi:hypothetical protein